MLRLVCVGFVMTVFIIWEAEAFFIGRIEWIVWVEGLFLTYGTGWLGFMCG